jgi:soluble lytic murein transglycosylase
MGVRGVSNRSANGERRNYSTYGAPRRSRIVRRRLTALAACVLLTITVIQVVPLAQRAIEHFELPLQYASIIRQQAAEKHVDAALIAAVIYAETRFRPRTSVTGAEGLMQIEPATARFLAHRSHGYAFRVADLGSPAVNIAYGTYYLRYLLGVYGGRKLLALAAYNAGETNVDKWLTTARAHHHTLTVGEIPLGQTSAYVAEVLGKQRAYRSHYARQLGYG